MKKVSNWLCLAVIITACIGFSSGTSISSNISKKQIYQKRPDLILIGSMRLFGELEQSPVAFLHDMHTTALAKKNNTDQHLTCSTCHLTENKKFSPKFKRIADTDRTTVMNLYHKECIACHGEMRLAKEKTGPVECGQCHTLKTPFTLERAPMGFDRSLHFRHSKASENKCEKCHHAYDETQKVLFYDKGKEGSCRYCHEEQAVDNRISMPDASHAACLYCHLNALENQKEIRQPVTCAGCHDKTEQERIQKVTDIPRMERNQPDLVLLKRSVNLNRTINAGTPETTGTSSNQMAFVPFNHQAHETASDTCRACHHNSLQACNDCHFSGDMIKKPSDALPQKQAPPIDEAMHLSNSRQSCVGCHNTVKKQINCSGCHDFIGQVQPVKTSTCDACHSVPAKNVQIPADKTREAMLAASIFKTREQARKTFPEEDIPETVIIKQLSNLYEPVTFPHRKVVNAISDRISKDALAGFFHGNEATLCQGCHHNSPASKKQPRCASCHGKQWDVKELTKPGILGAFHQQCMGCHAKMNIEKPMGCTECHELKKTKK